MTATGTTKETKGMAPPGDRRWKCTLLLHMTLSDAIVALPNGVPRAGRNCNQAAKCADHTACDHAECVPDESASGVPWLETVTLQGTNSNCDKWVFLSDKRSGNGVQRTGKLGRFE
jgi:hypothetical protein